MNRNLTYCQKYRLLLWKDIKLQLANVVELVMIILLFALMPIIFTIGTKVARSVFPPDIEIEKTPGPKSVNTSLFEKLYFTPNNGILEQLINQLANISGIKDVDVYDSNTELYLNLMTNKKAMGIAFPSEWHDIKSCPEVLNITIFMPLSIKRKDFKYFESGFLLLQERMSKIFIYHRNAGKEKIPRVLMNHFPYPLYVPNHYAQSAKAMTYLTLTSFFLPCITIAKYVVAEKERRQKAILSAMGFGNSVHWLAWYTKSMLLLIPCVMIMIIIFAIGSVYEFSNLICLILIFLVYVHSLVLFAFFVSSFFSKSLSAVVATLLIYLATGIPFLIVGAEDSSVASQTAASFGLNSALFYILASVATMEMQSVGLQWHTMDSTASNGHKLSIVAHMLIMFAISWIELLICLYVEALRPGQPFTNLDDRTQENFQNVPINSKIGVEIRSLSKNFGYRNIVRNLFLNAHENEITALVGHKGSGKTTTIMMLCGILQPTTGTALINGYDIVSEPKLAKSSLGICPQHSVLFKGMSARDHIYFFSRIKGYTKKEAMLESNIYINKLSLLNFQRTDAMKLSPGNQRRLSLACALCAGSKVILCDEPSSGLDAVGRHELWLFLQKEKRGRTILVTTQLLEEGEILADRIAIMNDGQILCFGTLGYIKQLPFASFTLSCQMAPNSKAEKLTDLIMLYMTTTTPLFRGSNVNYKLPRCKMNRFPELFQQLENNKKSLDVVSFGVSDTSLDGIYLSLDYGQGLRNRGGADPEDKDKADFSLQTEKSVRSKERATSSLVRYQQTVESSSKSEFQNDSILKPKASIYPIETWGPKNRRKGSCMAQWQAMIIKKTNYIASRALIFIIILIIPLLYYVVVLWTASLEKCTRQTDIPPVLPLSLDYYSYDDMTVLLEIDNDLYKSAGDAYIKSVKETATVQRIRSIFSYLLKASPLVRRDIRRKYVSGASFNNLSTVTAWFNSDAFEHSAPIAMNLVYNALGKAVLGENDFSIFVNRGDLHDFVFKDIISRTKRRSKRQNDPDYEDYPDYETQEDDNIVIKPSTSTTLADNYDSLYKPGDGNQLAAQLSILEASSTLLNEKGKIKQLLGSLLIITAYIALALSIFSLFVTKERVQYLKLQQEIYGVTLSHFWLTHFLGDLLIFAIYMVALTISIYHLTKWYQVFIMLLLIGFACLPFVYLCSFLFRQPTSAFAGNFTILVMTGGLLFYILYMFKLLTDVNFRTVFAILPMYVGAFGLFKCLTSREYCDREVLPPIDDLDCKFGSCNVFCACKHENNWIEVWLLIIHCLVWFFFLWFSTFGYEIGYRFKQKQSNRNWNISEKNIRVLDEEKRVSQIPKYEHDEYPIIVDQVTKKYCRTKAVQLVSFAIRPADCFGLLGARGAGKTSIFRMIAGETNMSNGNIYVRGHSLREHRKAAKMEVGYCPQGDTAFKFLTGRQVLRIYCLLHGVPKKDIKTVSEQIAIEFGFKDQLDKQIRTYSGGNRRKLNIALAIDCGSVICLDESNGYVDPTARRFICQKLEAVKKSGRPVLLTTQSMEEANALCSTVGLLVSGTMMFVGSLQQLRSEVTNTIMIRLKVNASAEEQKGNIQQVMTDMEELFPLATLREFLGNYLIYNINNNVTTLSNLFYQMEKLRDEGKLEDYSITQVSLDEIYKILDEEDDPKLIDLDPTENSEGSDDKQSKGKNIESDTDTRKEKDERKRVEKEDINKEKSNENKQQFKKRPTTSSESTDSDDMVVKKGGK
ncbi:phospholipid-transporting ATPase ABCA3 isoform X2 [Drosophila santomea]|uniref:phospholipid-transporting ATPase ABCA3 isoform X2 n=1 Tax=Drosophila santomea TaxID=129105 RepID=UPI001953F58F|nr:phospholipid-transporting ATPase ABCA3 isoform X2 [Drosophila santomea]